MNDSKTYLGDGAYVAIDSGDVVITTENGIATTNRVVLGGHEVEALLKFLVHTARHLLENVVHLDAAARVAVVAELRRLAGKADRPQRAARSKKEVCDGQP